MNENNLIPAAHKLTVEEQSNGGKKSAEARRRRKALKSLMNDLLSSEVFDIDIYNNTTAMGIDPEDMSYGAAIVAAMVKEAAGGNVKAFNAITDLVGEGSSGERIKLQKKQLQLQEQNSAVKDGDGNLNEVLEAIKNA